MNLRGSITGAVENSQDKDQNEEEIIFPGWRTE